MCAVICYPYYGNEPCECVTCIRRWNKLFRSDLLQGTFPGDARVFYAPLTPLCLSRSVRASLLTTFVVVYMCDQSLQRFHVICNELSHTLIEAREIPVQRLRLRLSPAKKSLSFLLLSWLECVHIKSCTFLTPL